MSQTTLQQRLESPRNLPKPNKGDLPSSEESLFVDVIEVKGPRLGASDPGQAPYGVIIESGPGRYRIEADCFLYGSDIRIARVRAIRGGAHPNTRRKRGTIPVELGLASFFDAQRLAQFALNHEDQFDDWCEDQVVMCDWQRVGVIHCEPADARIVYFTAGFGDGTYNVFTLRENGSPVGAAIEFISPGTPYPFGAQAHVSSGSNFRLQPTAPVAGSKSSRRGG